MCVAVPTTSEERKETEPLEIGPDYLECCNRHRTLVVDDEDQIVRIYKTVLSSSIPHLDVDIAENGREAVEAFKREHHAVLLMDLHMPVMDGTAAYAEIERVCRDRRWEMPDVLFCTAFAPPKALTEYVKPGGSNQLLIKPLSPLAVVEEVKRHLES